MTFAYADPPYPGCAKKHYTSDPSGIKPEEVDHEKLIQTLTDYDAWALSTKSSALRDILPLCPKGTRVGAWVKTQAALMSWLRVQYAWEPVIFFGARGKTDSDTRWVSDWVKASPPVFVNRNIGNTKGQKPIEFCAWLFALIGLQEGDELHDLFPGSGAVTIFWKSYLAQKQLRLSA